MEQRTVISIPLSAGLDTKTDPQALKVPKLAMCLDGEFDSLEALRLRKPYASIGANILGGGTLANIRKIVASTSELLCFTDVALYSWSARDTAWVQKGPHLAVASDEEPVFGSNGDQVGGDRAELANTVLLTWWDHATNIAYLAARDATTKAVIVPPTGLLGASQCLASRLVVLSSSVLVFFFNGSNDLQVKTIDPANVATSIAASATTVLSSCTGFYDVAKVPGADTVVVAASVSGGDGYHTAVVTSGLSVTSGVPAGGHSDAGVAVAVAPDASFFRVVIGNSIDAQSSAWDLTPNQLTSDGNAVTYGTGKTANVSCIFESAQVGGKWRCHIYASGHDSAGSALLYTNHVDSPTGGASQTFGTQAGIVYGLDLAAKPFDYGGARYLWLIQGAPTQVNGGQFTYQFQNTYFLYRDDGLLVAQAAKGVASDFTYYSPAVLPSVQLVSGSTGFAWLGAYHRELLASTQNSKAYGARAPREITFSFDDNRARRCLRLGKTLYITGSLPLQYDGISLYEVGFLVYPYSVTLQAGMGGLLADGTYAWKGSYRHTGGTGDVDRSTTATVNQTQISSGPTSIRVTSVPLTVTRRPPTQVTVEIWRTQHDPVDDSPFFLVSSQDPAATTGTNSYIANTTTGIVSPCEDAEADEAASANETNPENDGVLENLAPPSHSVSYATENRIFVAAIPSAPNAVWYSKQRDDGEVAAFHDALVATVPESGGAITAINLLDQTLVVFCERAIYMLPGQGFDNASGGTNYGPASSVSDELGAVSQEGVCSTDQGLLFKSQRGWVLLNKGWTTQYIGAGAAQWDGEDVLDCRTVVGQYQVRIVTANRVLMFDTRKGEWAQWSIAGAVGACVHSGTYHYATTSGVFAELPDFGGGVDYGLDIELAWYEQANATGQSKIRWIMPLGIVKSTCDIRIRVARNYQSDGAGGWSYFDDVYRTPLTTVGGPLQVQYGPSISSCEAIKIRLTAASPARDGSFPTGEGFSLTSMNMEIGMAPGLYKGVAKTQRS